MTPTTAAGAYSAVAKLAGGGQAQPPAVDRTAAGGSDSAGDWGKIAFGQIDAATG